ncbi:MAG: energy transducer TonB [Ignavibacteriae bacterium]|nr:energy transducer TonB [Ignavibacteriota bacterium]MCB9243358.1 energy transducer TonB [Ignavibacteriales bacterium]
MIKYTSIIILLLAAGYLHAQDDQHKKEEAPTPLNLGTVRSMIHYPDSARIKQIEGRVVVKVLVDAYGNVEYVSNELTGPEVFHDEIIRVSRYLKFAPAKLDGVPVKCWISVPFNFMLRNPSDESEDQEE